MERRLVARWRESSDVTETCGRPQWREKEKSLCHQTNRGRSDLWKRVRQSGWEIAAAAKYKRICQLGTQQRSDPMQAEIKETGTIEILGKHD